MIATVTLNAAIDKLMTAPGLAVGRTNRAQTVRVDAGGKGINVAAAVRQLGYPVVASGFLAGRSGAWILDALAAKEIPAEFLEIPGETRVNLKLVDPAIGQHTEINDTGTAVEQRDLARLERKVEELASRCRVLVFSGSLPPGAPNETYATLLQIAKRRGAKTILDTSGPALKCGIAAGPDLVKPNLSEAEELLGRSIQQHSQAAEAAGALRALGARSAVISMGAAGAVGCFENSRPAPYRPGRMPGRAGGPGTLTLRAAALAMPPANSTGAGDAMVAAFACAMLENRGWPDALRLAVAAGSLASANSQPVGDFSRLNELAERVQVVEVLSQRLAARPR